MTAPRDILDFWFGDKGEARAEWFRKSDAIDAEIRSRFGPAVERAVAGDYADWETNAEAALALILLLDQFPRNIRRSSLQAFSGDARAIAVAGRAKGFDRDRSEVERVFFYLPFEHSEDIADQRTCLRLMGALADPRYARYAQAHHDIIARFGRFPHRNAVLGRKSTAEELEFLKQPGSLRFSVRRMERSEIRVRCGGGRKDADIASLHPSYKENA